MNPIRIFRNILCAAAALTAVGVSLTSCIEDDVTLSPADQPVFSADTLDVGRIFMDEPSQTHAIKAYNHSDKVMRISRIGFQSGSEGCFRINVDGFSGKDFRDVDIRPNDSIFILVSATVPRVLSASSVEDKLEFETNGVTRSVVLKATGVDAVTLTDPVIDSDTRWDAEKPVRIYGELTVAPGVSLTLGEGLTVYMHDKASIEVHGSLRSEGTADAPVVIRGDRSGTVITGITFDLMSRQWAGMTIHPDASPCELCFTEIRNTEYGVFVDGPTATDVPQLTLIGCRLRNSRDNVLAAYHTSVRAVSTEFAESGASPVWVIGGEALFDHCTFSNYYLFSAITGPLLQVSHCTDDNLDAEQPGLPRAKVRVTNSVLYGMSADMSPTSLDGTDVYVHRCLLRSPGSDDEHFTDIIWGGNPLFRTQREEYYFDYRLGADSPALGASDPATTAVDLPVTDFYGAVRPAQPAIGAYEIFTE
ncbi:MAG: hypothetical protein K2H74_05745 [Paramuribaculum sp.]|nr:hypothetical protein [Paramuribaculum sp.]